MYSLVLNGNFYMYYFKIKITYVQLSSQWKRKQIADVINLRNFVRTLLSTLPAYLLWQKDIRVSE